MSNRIRFVFTYLRVSLFAFVALLATNQAVLAQVEINVSGAQVRGIPIAVVPFKVLDGQQIDHQIHKIVAFDLDATGKFESISTDKFLAFPSRPEEYRAKDWRLIDAEIVVFGEVWNLGSLKYEVQFRIFDVARDQEIGTGKRVSNISERDLRTAAHLIADEVYAAFTGRGPAFQSNMVYVQRSEIEYQRFRYKLMVADWDGWGAREVFGSWNPILSPAWSPDGSKIAFVGFAPQGAVIRVLDLASGKDELIANFKGVNSAPAWSPDGSKLAYSTSRHGSPDVHIYDFATGQHQRVNTHYGIDTEPSFHPRGESLLFTSNRSGKPQIYSYSLLDQSVSRITFEGNESANASYSADGTMITMVHEGGQIVTMNEETSRITYLTNAKFDESPSFAPNGDLVMYKTEQNYEPVIMVASSDGRVRTQLRNISGDVREPNWSAGR